MKLSVPKKVKRGAVATAGLRAMIAAKRKGNVMPSGDELKENEPVQQEDPDEAKMFDGGFFTVKSPSASNLKSQSVVERNKSKSAGLLFPHTV